MRAGIPLLVMILVAVGCADLEKRAGLAPEVTGSHALNGLIRADAPERYLIWSTFAVTETTLISLLLERHQTVVERGRLQQLLQEQQFQAGHAREQDVLRLGALAGATVVIFADTHGFSGDKNYAQSVTLRAVDIESGTVRWMGRAFYPKRRAAWAERLSPDQLIGILTEVAFFRAQCPVENGWRWIDPIAHAPTEAQLCVQGH